jgi:hypothetical protein
MSKIDLVRAQPALYRPPRTPVIVDVPEMSFLMLDGTGDPNTSAEYAAAIAALYSVSYTIKFTLRRAPQGSDYKVLPLEGLWWADDVAAFGLAQKQDWRWTMMIGQPDLATPALVAQACAEVLRTKRLPAVSRVRLERFHEGRCAQVMYVGPYSEEAPTIAALHAFIRTQGYTFDGRRQKHHEIYLSDPRRTAPTKLRTVIRQPMVPAASVPDSPQS